DLLVVSLQLRLVDRLQPAFGLTGLELALVALPGLIGGVFKIVIGERVRSLLAGRFKLRFPLCSVRAVTTQPSLMVLDQAIATVANTDIERVIPRVRFPDRPILGAANLLELRVVANGLFKGSHQGGDRERSLQRL